MSLITILNSHFSTGILFTQCLRKDIHDLSLFMAVSISRLWSSVILNTDNHSEMAGKRKEIRVLLFCQNVKLWQLHALANYKAAVFVSPCDLG